ncbi:MAG: acetyl-CoA carboxylase, carboxyltransferase subunit beta [Planctomycetota bacterium]|nr:acetyl-CoA carboxylase, carboxyltransferase subunit beta [Planctomycetota bacterium]
MARKQEIVPDPDMVVCEKCGSKLRRKELDDGFGVCPKCDYHFEIGWRRRIELLLDKGSFQGMDDSLAPFDVLKFEAKSSYWERLKKSQEVTGAADACITGRGKIEGKEVAFGVTDPFFMRGSMGSVVGEKIARLAETALRERLPMVFVSGSGGGARMDEGMFSLMQMAKVSAAIGSLRSSGGLYISVLTNPTMGGALASFAALGDIILAEPGALIGFAGPNVIKQTIKTDLPEGFQRSEFLLEKGFIDRVVHRSELKKTIAQILDFCL